MLGYDAKAASLAKGVEELNNEINNAKQPELAMADMSQPYWQAKRKLEELQRLGQVLNVKILSERTDMDLPKTSMVEIVDRATPASKPTATLWQRIAGGAKYESKARVKVERDQSDIQGMSQAQSTGGYDPYFLATETEVLQSDIILSKVADELNLSKAWSQKDGKPLTKDQTMAMLKKNLELRPVRNASLLEIGFKSDEPEEAAKVANAVADAYQEHRREERRRLSEGGIDALTKRVADQEQKIAAAQAEVDRLGAELRQKQAETVDAGLPRKSVSLPVPQPETKTRGNAFSTFSLNVSDVSFKLAAASLEQGVMPDPASIRSEEFINAFDYRDPEPAAGAAMAFAWERARYPFAQNRDLLRFSLKTAALGRQAGRPLNLVLLLDNSGSMERADRVQIIHEALRVLAGQLQAQDVFSVVTFARTPRLFADWRLGKSSRQGIRRRERFNPARRHEPRGSDEAGL